MINLKIIKSKQGCDLIVYHSYTFYREKHVNDGVKIKIIISPKWGGKMGVFLTLSAVQLLPFFNSSAILIK